MTHSIKHVHFKTEQTSFFVFFQSELFCFKTFQTVFVGSKIIYTKKPFFISNRPKEKSKFYRLFVPPILRKRGKMKGKIKQQQQTLITSKNLSPY